MLGLGWRVVWVASAALIGGCDGTSSEPEPEPEPESGAQDPAFRTLRLFDGEDEGTGVDCSYVRWGEDAAGCADAGTVWDLANPARPASTRLSSLRGTALELAAEAAWILPLTARHTGVLSLSVRGRAGPDARLVVWSLRKPLASLEGSRQPNRFFNHLQRRVLDVPWAPTDDVETVDAQWDVEGGDRHFLCVIQSGASGSAFERVEVREAWSDLITPRRVGGTWRRALPVAMGARWSTAAPSGATQCRWALAWPDEACRRTDDVTVTVRADERVVSREVFSAEGAAPRVRRWRDVRVAWPPGAERLSVDVAGVDAGLMLLAEPVWSSPPQQRGAPNVVVISIDTLRADRLGSAGNPRGLTPNLDRLARRGVRMSHMSSPANYTLPGHAALWTGRAPPALGIGGAKTRGHLGGAPTLATRCADAGYATAAFTGGGYVDPAFGFARGFERYSVLDPLMSSDNPSWHASPRAEEPAWNDAVRAGSGFESVLEWVRSHKGGPFFLMLHTYRVHEYSPSDDAIARFATDTDPALGRAAHVRLLQRATPDVQPGSSILHHLQRYYDATVWDVDRALGRLFAVLDEEGLTDHTLVAVTSDHGEAFLEHGRLFHSSGLFDEVLRVPWLLAGPGVAQGAVVDSPASLVDVAPTLLDLAGLPALPGVEGISLRPLAAADVGERSSISREAVYAYDLGDESALGEARIEARWKLLDERRGTPRTLLFDRLADPSEQTDLAFAHPDEVERMRRVLEEHRAWLRDEAQRVAPKGGALDPSLAETLEQLGYIVR